ncbi:nucleoside deaminase [Streptomyces sp. NPDC048350]|uniref:nucleoside deaminase n=1 Tax=Streptomyces sp. NPDC048350 TaxID=3365538 RepID=UPI003717814B
MTPVEEKLLRRAIELAVAARAAGDPPFGSLLVGPGGEVLREECNTTVTENDITLHPELKLARWAARELDASTAFETTMYTSCQPCGMCTGAIERSGLGGVVFALSTEQLGALKPSTPMPDVRMHGPSLFDLASAAVDGYYL